MLPIRDHNPSLRTPWVTWGLIIANVVIFLAYLPYMGDEVAIAGFFGDWAMIPARVASGEGAHTLVTSMFLHAGIMHLAGNMLFLWIFGDNMEEQLGHVGFLIFYLAAGILADAAHLLADPGSLVPTVGASGAIAGVMGGYLLLFPRARVDILLILIVYFRIFSVPAWLMLGLWFGFQVVNGLSADISGGGVAYWAHAGGFVVGFLWVLPLWLRRGGTGFWNRTHGQPPHPVAEYRMAGTRIPRVIRRRA